MTHHEMHNFVKETQEQMNVLADAVQQLLLRVAALERDAEQNDERRRRAAEVMDIYRIEKGDKE